MTTRREFLRKGAVGATVALATPYSFTRTLAQERTMTFWALDYVAKPDSPQGKWWIDMQNEWNDTHAVKVSVEAVSATAAEYYTKLSTRFAANDGPDLFLLSASDFLRYANNDLLVDLRQYMTKEAVEDFLPDVMTSRMVGDKILALPMTVQPMAMFYSKAAFDEAGLTDADVPKTYDELIDVAARLTTPDRYGVLFHTSPGVYQVFSWYPFMWQGGGEIMTAEGRSAFNSPATIGALKLWKDLIESGSAPRELLGSGGGALAANLGSGYCAMQNCGIWGLGQMRNDAPDFEYGVFRIPTPPGAPNITVAGGWAMVANARGTNVDEAAELINWSIGSADQSAKDRMLSWEIDNTSLPPRKSVVEAGLASGAFSSSQFQAFASDILPTSRGEPRTPAEIYTHIGDAIQEAVLNGGDPTTIAAAASDLIDEYLATYDGAEIL